MTVKERHEGERSEEEILKRKKEVVRGVEESRQEMRREELSKGEGGRRGKYSKSEIGREV